MLIAWCKIIQLNYIPYILNIMHRQVEMITLADLVAADHIYRKFAQLIDIRRLVNKYLKTAQGSSNYKGYGTELLFKALLLQHLGKL